MPPRLILGIETSCDETSAAVLSEGRTVLSNIVASQLIHADYGGVVPELASREHLRAVVPVVREAMAAAGLPAGPEGYRRLSAVAVTEGPGLAGALLVGITFAKALAFAADLPLIAVNHLEGHIQAVLLEAEQRFAEASPLLAAVVSGGHSHLYLATRNAEGLWHYRNIGRTVDDAAGEAFDKVAKLLGLPYPGGPWIDALAPHGNPAAVPFRFAQIKPKNRPNSGFPNSGSPNHGSLTHGSPISRNSPNSPSPLVVIPAGDLRSPSAPGNTGTAPTPSPGAPSIASAMGGITDPRFDVSFSGIKTAVRRHVELHAMREAVTAREAAMRSNGLLTSKPNNPAAFAAALALLDPATLDLIASFQASVTGYLTRTILNAAQHFGARALAVSGGVAANRELRQRLEAAAAKQRIPLAFPSLSLSTDNAAMIAAAAWPKLLNRRFADTTLEAAPGLRLG